MLPLCLASALVASGCGGGRHVTTTIVLRTATPNAAADCLNADLFIVQVEGRQILGSSPGGVNFTVTFYASPAAANAALGRLNPRYGAAIVATVVDYSGNPPRRKGAAPPRLINDDFATLRHCIVVLPRG